MYDKIIDKNWIADNNFPSTKQSDFVFNEYKCEICSWEKQNNKAAPDKIFLISNSSHKHFELLC